MRAALPWSRPALVALLLLHAVPPRAQSPAPAGAPTRRYDIAAQPLQRALIELGRVGRLDILYENGVVDGETSTALAGRYTPSEAVGTMLRGTRLSYRFTSANAVLIFPPDRPPLPAPLAGTGATADVPRLVLDPLRVSAPPLIGRRPQQGFDAFGRIVQREINRRLQNDPRTSNQPFRARLAVSVDPAGIVHAASVARSTGEPALDDAIRQIVEGLRLPDMPPADLPQPIWFEVSAR